MLFFISQDDFLAESLFGVFDEDNSGALDFYELMLVKNAPMLSTPEEKLNWIFTAFDQDGGGFIDLNEIMNIVIGLFKMAGMDEDFDMVAACVSEIRQAVDKDDDGTITREEFVKNAAKSSFISNNIIACQDGSQRMFHANVLQ